MPLPQRLRWVASNFDGLRTAKAHWTEAYFFAWRAYASNSDEAISAGLIVGERCEWIANEQGVQPFRYKDAKGSIHYMKEGIPACSNEYRAAIEAFDYAASLGTDWVREAFHHNPDLFDPEAALAAVFDKFNRWRTTKPRWGAFELQRGGPELPDGYFVSGGDAALIEYWPDVLPELIQLAGLLERFPAREPPILSEVHEIDKRLVKRILDPHPQPALPPAMQSDVSPQGSELAHSAASTFADNPRVFVSYCSESTAHGEMVAGLIARLRSDGVDVRSDLDEDPKPAGLPSWMQQQLRDADFVLCICSREYRRRFEGEAPPTEGQGVRFEGHLITQAIYETGATNVKFLPVVFDSEGIQHRPEILRSFEYFDVSDPKRYGALVHRLRSVSRARRLSKATPSTPES